MRVVLLALAACSATDTGESGKAPAENTAPVVKFLEPRGTSFDVDEVITFEADVSDAEDSPDQLDFSWTAIDGTAYAVDSTPEPDGHLEGTLALKNGTYTITLAATDPHGAVGTASVSFEVITPNALPECTIFNPIDGELFVEGESVLLVGQTTDVETESGDLVVEWESDQDGDLGASVAASDGTVDLLAETLSLGDHELSLKAMDEEGGRCTARVAVRVNGAGDR